MENSTPDTESENSSGLRKRVGRPPKLHTQTEITETIEGFEQPPEDEEEELETMEDEQTGSASPTNLCRRSTRKKTVKFDVLDVLNKSRKTHKIQIEARIDSNAPTTTAPGTSSANRFVATRPLLPTVPPLSAIKLFTKPKPMPSLIVAQVSSDKMTVVKQAEPPQSARRRGRPRKNQAGDESTGSFSDVDSNKEGDISNPNWESSESNESSKELPVSFIVEESTNESSSAVLEEQTTQVVLDDDSDSEIIFIDVDEAATQHEVVIEAGDNSSDLKEQQTRHFEFIIQKEEEQEIETVSSNLTTEDQPEQSKIAAESELVTEVLSEPPNLWYIEEEVVEEQVQTRQQEEQEKTAEASKLINEELTDLVTSLHVQEKVVEQVEEVQPVEIYVEGNNLQQEAEIVAEMNEKLSIGEEEVLSRPVSTTENSPALPAAQIEAAVEQTQTEVELQLKPESLKNKSESPPGQLSQAETAQIETVPLSLLPEPATTSSKMTQSADKESVASTSKAAAAEVEKTKKSNSPTSRQEKPSSASSVVECDALFKALDKADAQLRHEEKAKKKLKPTGKKQTTTKQETPRQSPSTPPVRSKKQQGKKSSRRNTISEEHHEPESTLSVTNKRRNSLHPFKASPSPERQQQQPGTDSKLGKKGSTKKPPRKAAGAARQVVSNQDSLDSQPSRSITTTPTCEQQQQQQQEEPNPLQDIAKFIEDGVKLLERDYKLEDEQQQQLTEDELAQRVANLETPAATPTPSPAVSTEDLSLGVRRSHRIKQKPQSSSKSNASSRANSSSSNTPSISMEQQLSELATVEQINEQFLRQEGLHTFQTLRDNYYRCARQVSKENAEMQCDCFVTGDEAEGLGQVPCGDGCINRMLMIECGPLCTNGERCTNKRFQQHQGWPCRVFRTEKKGCGITAELQIPPGEFIMEYVGEVIDSEEFERRQHLYSEDRNRHYYFMALRGDSIIDATSRGNISRYINHSCDPNAETQKWTVNGELRIGFFSLKTIMPGEEITFDYQYQRYGRDAQRCYCESSNCRGWIGNEPESDEGEGEQLDTESDSEVESQEDEQPLEQEQEQKAKATKSSKSKLDLKLPAARRKRKEQHGVRSKEREYKAGRWLRPTGPGGGEKSASGKHDHIEDPDVLEQLTLLSRSGLKNQLDTLRFSRCMVRAKLLQSRLQLLGVLTRGELPCRRLFLDYHGLRLLHAWISEGGSDRQLRLALLEALESLPIPNKTMLNDSRVYQCVQEWSSQSKEEEEEAAAADPNPNPDLTQRILALLQKWNGLPEIFRIPKRERIEQMKEHEREADRQQLELESNSASSLLSTDRYKQDRFRRDTSSRYEKAKPPTRMSGNNTICTITTQPSSIDGAKLESRRRLEYEPRRTITKEQRRSLFEKKVAQDEAEKRVGSEEWREHELRCEYFGADLNTDRKLLPFYQNTETNEWFNSDDMPVPAPQRCGDPAAPPSPESIAEVEYKLPAGVEPLPPSWHWSMTPEGDIYYYNLRDRIPQWEPPSAEQRLQQLVEDSPVTEPELVDEALSELEMVNIDIDCGSTLSAKSLAQYIEVKIRERREMRRNRLVSVRMISPRREEDRIYNQAESRKYKENKEKIRRRKEIYRRTRNEANNPEQPTELEPGDSLPIHRYLYSSDEETADDGSIFSVAPLDTTLDGDGDELNASRSSSTETDSLQSAKRKFSPSEGHKKQRSERDKKRKTNTTGRDASAKFHFEISGHVAELLRPYRQETCQLGRITSDEDYKFLIKRLSHHITTKEMRYCDMTGNPLAYTESVKHKSYDFINQYMRKKGPVYKKPVEKAD